jgi:type II secretory pathway component GspD/PulD (secretin)
VSIGTTVIVQPRLGDGDEVMLALYLEANSLRATDPQTGLPEIGQRSARCSLRVRDNETVAIAGLQLADDTKEWRKIPFLGNLPLVGALFRTPVRSRSETQLAVFLTTHIVKPQTAEQGANRRG